MATFCPVIQWIPNFTRPARGTQMVILHRSILKVDNIKIQMRRACKNWKADSICLQHSDSTILGNQFPFTNHYTWKMQHYQKHYWLTHSPKNSIKTPVHTAHIDSLINRLLLNVCRSISFLWTFISYLQCTNKQDLSGLCIQKRSVASHYYTLKLVSRCTWHLLIRLLAI